MALLLGQIRTLLLPAYLAAAELSWSSLPRPPELIPPRAYNVLDELHSTVRQAYSYNTRAMSDAEAAWWTASRSIAPAYIARVTTLADLTPELLQEAKGTMADEEYRRLSKEISEKSRLLATTRTATKRAFGELKRFYDEVRRQQQPRSVVVHRAVRRRPRLASDEDVASEAETEVESEGDEECEECEEEEARD